MKINLAEIHQHVWRLAQQEDCESAGVEREFIEWVVDQTLEYLKPHIVAGEELAVRTAADVVVRFMHQELRRDR